MGYRKQDQKWADTEDVTLHASAARTASGSGTGVELGDRSGIRLDLAVTAASGTKPSLQVDLETSSDNATWRPVGGFTALASTGTQRMSLGGLDRFVRAVWTISGSGSPSFTFSVSGEAV
jgi:hypothetical protein